MNPYESPRTPCQPPATPGETIVRGRGLVSASLGLAVLIELLPTEADLVWVALSRGDLSSCLAVKATCLAIILVPLFLYLWVNGWRDIMAARGRLAAIGVILALKLGMDMACLVNYLPHH